MNRTKWTRTRAVNQPSKSKTARYDEQNAEAAAIILASPEQHRWFQVDWAQRFTERRAAESSQVDRTADRQQVSRQLPLNLA